MWASSIKLKQTGQEKSEFFSSYEAPDAVGLGLLGVRIEERLGGMLEPLCEEAELERPSRFEEAIFWRF